ncbi:hypothetical protein [Thermocaproicibacter melissae]|jgi:hypothetical protein|uniref:hypothetical protein n=1 Tax=Thermocaproicibacter melissae TaxID=2966552 RepID=UPI003A0FD904
MPPNILISALILSSKSGKINNSGTVYIQNSKILAETNGPTLSAKIRPIGRNVCLRMLPG